MNVCLLWGLCNVTLDSLRGVLRRVLCVCVREALTMRRLWPTWGLRAMNMYTLINSVPKLRPGQPAFVSRQRQWLVPPSECRPALYSLYSKDKHDRHETTVQIALQWRPPPIWTPLKTLAVFQVLRQKYCICEFFRHRWSCPLHAREVVEGAIEAQLHSSSNSELDGCDCSTSRFVRLNPG
jgi:hypothetical protein